MNPDPKNLRVGNSQASKARKLIHTTAKRNAEQHLETKLLEGVRSTETEVTPAGWRANRKEALALLQGRGK